MKALHRMALEIIKAFGEVSVDLLAQGIAEELCADGLIKRDGPAWKLTDAGMLSLGDAPPGGWSEWDVTAGGSTKKTRGSLVFGALIELAFPGRPRLVMTVHEYVWLAMEAIRSGSVANNDVIQSMRAEIGRELMRQALHVAAEAERAAAEIRAACARTEKASGDHL